MYGLIQIHIWVTARPLPKCNGFISILASVISPFPLKVVGDCMRNAIKFIKMPYCAMLEEMESDPESVVGTESPSKFNRSFMH